PDWLLLDEPARYLDSGETSRIRDLIAGLHQQEVGVIVASPMENLIGTFEYSRLTLPGGNLTTISSGESPPPGEENSSS
ncbi:MAG: ABC transporter ATP-binding protein, partial [bacterium]